MDPLLWGCHCDHILCRDVWIRPSFTWRWNDGKNSNLQNFFLIIKKKLSIIIIVYYYIFCFFHRSFNIIIILIIESRKSIMNINE